MENMAKPAIVSAGKWQQTRDDLLKAEKEAARALDAPAARRRRRLPKMNFSDHCMFDTPAGPKALSHPDCGAKPALRSRQ
jgi:predicted dithiol-disulfide oxidoreductase (DUF899 family)